MMAWPKRLLEGLANSVYNLTARELPRSCSLPREPFQALNEFFDAIWVLTIGRNIERRRHIDSRLGGIHFRYFEGVDGKTLTAQDPRIDLSAAEAVNKRVVGINELACTMSHLVMFQEIVSKGLSRVLIFEDDASYIARRAKWVRYCLERLPADWELLYFGYGDGELRGYLRELQEKLGRRKDPAEVVTRTVGRGIRTASGHDFTHSYAVTLQGARKLLEDAYPVRHTADGWLENKVLQRKLAAYIVVPKVFVQQAALGSSIHRK